ncbi:hypothetical protein F5050DRAFT_282325 [Lentinula boryana]|uniref:Uncharacterized protein n=1 Tax=Lentinula boryana TaxID=40481 RepID=A0ABQ8QQY9_9AGAR|nr:hypothetical protein F5050DRAFT_282325 [Lentinula boryana]
MSSQPRSQFPRTYYLVNSHVFYVAATNDGSNPFTFGRVGGQDDHENETKPDISATSCTASEDESKPLLSNAVVNQDGHGNETKPDISATFCAESHDESKPAVDQDDHKDGIRSESNSDSDKDDDKVAASPTSDLPPAASATVHPDEGLNTDTEDIPSRSFRPFTPPTTAELTNRLRQAKRTGRTIHELIHELQNEFYPLIPPRVYVIPHPGLYSATVEKLQTLKTLLDSRGDDDDPSSPLTPRVVSQPAFVRKVTRQPWTLYLMDYLKSMALRAVKRRKRDEMDVDEEERWVNENSSDSRSRKRRRV